VLSARNSLKAGLDRAAFDRPADEHFVVPAAVEISRIARVDALVQRFPDGRDVFAFIRWYVKV
jgi:hypothetical protein